MKLTSKVFKGLSKKQKEELINKNKNKRMLEKLTRDKLPLTAREKRTHVAYILIICSLLAYFVPAREGMTYYHTFKQERKRVMRDITVPLARATSTLIVKATSTVEVDTQPVVTKQDEASLNLLIGTKMEDAATAIAEMSQVYSVPVGLFTGIAQVESQMNEDFYIESDKDCHNPWGIKPNGGIREDGSYLRCFSSWEESTEYFAQLIKDHYFAQGLTSVEKIAPMWKCGTTTLSACTNADNWISIVYDNGYF